MCFQLTLGFNSRPKSEKLYIFRIVLSLIILL